MHSLLFYYVPVQTIIVSPYNANCVTPSIYPTTDLDFLFWIIVSCDLCFWKLHTTFYPAIVITKTRHVLYTCTCLYILLPSWKRDHYVFYEHVDTRIPSLGYIKLKRLDNDIKQKAFQKLVQIMKLKKPRKKCHICGIEPACITKTLCARSGTVQRLTHWATLSSISRSVITCTVQVNQTRWLLENKDEKFCKITKICLLETK